MTTDISDVIVKMHELIHLLEKGKKRGLLLAPRSIMNINKLVGCCSEDIVVFLYDTSWTFSEFMKQLHKTLGPLEMKSLEKIAWAFHGNMIDFNIVSDFSLTMTERNNIGQWQHFVDIITTIRPYLRSECKRIDFMGCSLFNNPDFEILKVLLDYCSDLKCATSKNATGNVRGADWVLEDGKINLLNLYFKEDMIRQLDVDIELRREVRDLRGEVRDIRERH